MLSNYPPGVTGNEPEITGIYICECWDYYANRCTNTTCDNYEGEN